MARERRRACYSLVSSIKDIVGESFIEDDADDQQKGDRNAMSDSKQKQTKIDTKFERPTETDSKETHTHTDTQTKIETQTHAHTLDKKWIIEVIRWELNPLTCNWIRNNDLR